MGQPIVYFKKTGGTAALPTPLVLPALQKKLESAHKYIRAFRVRLARFSSTNDNLLDVIARLYCKVSPIFRSLKPKPTRINVPKPPVLNEDDEMVNSFFLDEENL